jgi:hypothetical protein
MAITLSREAYLEFRGFGMADEYPKDLRAAVSELRRRGYDASVALLQYMVEEGLAEPEGDYWSEGDIDAAAEELEERAAYDGEARFFLHLVVDAAEYFRALQADGQRP